ncbi:MAG: hypothetical protein SAK29_35695 [Scytonema sp. PMC 1069.18]|nr:hypothetical protein [Scytonema sp. PMC 1069.18]MEC4881893.1 hypothetical protein [Scytonema sp. PMC 1070.18]
MAKEIKSTRIPQESFTEKPTSETLWKKLRLEAAFSAIILFQIFKLRNA